MRCSQRPATGCSVLAPAPDDSEPGRALCCGRTYLSLGQVDAARREAARMLAALRPALAAARRSSGSNLPASFRCATSI